MRSTLLLVLAVGALALAPHHAIHRHWTERTEHHWGSHHDELLDVGEAWTDADAMVAEWQGIELDLLLNYVKQVQQIADLYKTVSAWDPSVPLGGPKTSTTSLFIQGTAEGDHFFAVCFIPSKARAKKSTPMIKQLLDASNPFYSFLDGLTNYEHIRAAKLNPTKLPTTALWASDLNSAANTKLLNFMGKLVAYKIPKDWDRVKVLGVVKDFFKAIVENGQDRVALYRLQEWPNEAFNKNKDRIKVDLPKVLAYLDTAPNFFENGADQLAVDLWGWEPTDDTEEDHGSTETEVDGGSVDDEEEDTTSSPPKGNDS